MRKLENSNINIFSKFKSTLKSIGKKNSSDSLDSNNVPDKKKTAHYVKKTSNNLLDMSNLLHKKPSNEENKDLIEKNENLIHQIGK